MSNSTKLDAITAQLETSPKDMPHISTSSSKPNYTSLKLFQEAININAMTIILDTTELVNLAFTRSAADFYNSNGDVSFITLTRSGNNPTTLVCIATHTSAAALLLNPDATAETTDPYLAQESQSLFKEKQRQFNRYRNTKSP